MLLKQGKTNWNYILIVVVLAVIVIGGVWWCSQTPTEGEKICQDRCGNEICEEVVCLAVGCPCPETKESCPQDCEDETANREIYYSERGGFSFYYPEDWIINEKYPYPPYYEGGDKEIKILAQLIDDIPNTSGACRESSKETSESIKAKILTATEGEDFTQSWWEMKVVSVASVRRSQTGIPYVIGIDTCVGRAEKTSPANHLAFISLFYIDNVQIEVWMTFDERHLQGIKIAGLRSLANDIWNNRSTNKLLQERWQTFNRVIDTIEPIDETAAWKTYRNEEIGIEFEYPSILGTPEVLYVDNTQKESKDVFNGKKIDIYFKENGYGWIYFAAYTSNYRGFKEFLAFTGSDNIASECPNPLIYGEAGEACKIIEVAGEKAIWDNYFIEDECAASFGSRIYFNNKSPSIYKGLKLTFFLKDAREKVLRLYNCIDEEEMRKSYSDEAVIQSRNIMERRNLSEDDLQRLELIDQLLSTFRFLE